MLLDVHGVRDFSLPRVPDPEGEDIAAKVLLLLDREIAACDREITELSLKAFLLPNSSDSLRRRATAFCNASCALEEFRDRLEVLLDHGKPKGRPEPAEKMKTEGLDFHEVADELGQADDLPNKVLPIRRADSLKTLLRLNIAKLTERAGTVGCRYAHFPDEDLYRVQAIEARAQVFALDDLLKIIGAGLDPD